jgi:hypothetical protein
MAVQAIATIIDFLIMDGLPVREIILADVASSYPVHSLRASEPLRLLRRCSDGARPPHRVDRILG